MFFAGTNENQGDAGQDRDALRQTGCHKRAGTLIGTSRVAQGERRLNVIAAFVSNAELEKQALAAASTSRVLN